MGRSAADIEPCGLVQVVHLRWGKSSRGGLGARERSAVPQAFLVPATDLAGASGHLCVSVSHWDERNAFSHPLSDLRQRIALADGYTFGCVGVSPHAEGLQVRYQYDRGNGGAPERWFFSESSGYGETSGKTVVVRSGEWVRCCYNGRFSGLYDGNWRYEQVTVNVAWFSGEPEGGVFLNSEQSAEIRMLADLW